MTKQIDWVAEAKKSWKLGYEQGGLDALERYLVFQKRPKENIHFWKEWLKTCLRLDEATLPPPSPALSDTLAVVDELEEG